MGPVWTTSCVELSSWYQLFTRFTEIETPGCSSFKSCKTCPKLNMLHDGPTWNRLEADKTWNKIKDRFWRPGLSTVVREHRRNYFTCATCKSSKKSKAPLKPMDSGHPMQRVHVNIVGSLSRSKKGNLYILTVLSSFNKWVEAYSLRNQRAVTCAIFLSSIGIVGIGFQTVSSRNFQSNVFQEMYNLLQMKKKRTNTYHQQGNEQVETTYRTLEALLKTRLEHTHHLDYCLNGVQR